MGNIVKKRLIKVAAAATPFIADGFTETTLPGDIGCFIKKIKIDGRAVTVTIDDGYDNLPVDAEAPVTVNVTVDRRDGSARTESKNFANAATAVGEYMSFVDKLIADSAKTASIHTAISPDANRNSVMQLAGMMFDKIKADGFGTTDKVVLVMDVENGKINGFKEYRGSVTNGSVDSGITCDEI